MAIKKVKLPNDITQDIYDARISGIDSAPTTNSTNLVTSGGIKTAFGGYLPLAGGDMNRDATLKFNSLGKRYLTLDGDSIVLDFSADTGNYIGGLSGVKTTGSDGQEKYTSVIGVKGTYMSGIGIDHLFVAFPGNDATNPSVKLEPNNNATFAGTVTASQLIKSGGTSSQFLKADGTVDSTSYQKAITISSSEPTTQDGENGDIWLVI